MRRREECCANPGFHHRGPSVARLLPKREAPRELTAFDHPLVTTPGGIDNDVETVATFTNLSEQILDFAINEVIALNALD
jgi:hypothetical protein